MGKLSVIKINDHITKINETDETSLNVDAYLVEGEQRAVVIDSLQDDPDLYDTILSLTNKPISLIITHGHPDHAGVSTKKFVENHVNVYLNEKDLPVLETFVKEDWKNELKNIQEGDIFDLGGIQLEVIECAGHTPGSIVLYDKQQQEMYTGDAIGSGGFWMQLDHSLPLHKYLDNVERLYDLVKDDPQLKLYFGHSYQSDGIQSLPYIQDNITATIAILSGKLTSELQTLDMGYMKLVFCSVKYGLMKDYCFNPKNL